MREKTVKDLWKEDLDAFLEKLDVRYTMLLGYIIHIDVSLIIVLYLHH